MRRKCTEKKYDVAIVGGGLTGICAAIASARGGADTVLIHDRPVLGGNASSEIRMHICGASANRTKRDAEETGIIHEILLDNKACNDYHNFSIWDNVLFQKVKNQKNLTLLLNTSMQDVEVKGDRIAAVSCYQMTTETHLKIRAQIFVDCTGNGSLAYFAGAEYRLGCEGKAEFSEPDAPEEANSNRMGNTLLFKAVDRGHPVIFKTPDWSRRFTEDDLKYRRHGNYCPKVTSADDIEAPGDNAASDSREEKSSFYAYGLDYGYWWIELPGNSEDHISEYEDIRDELVKCVYGVWDHLKNAGDHGAENFDLQWVGMLPGVREGRRVVGDYILTENDLLSNTVFPDAVAYGGWPIDNHAPRGLDDKDIEASFVRQFPGLYTIPYRCYCNKDFKNLMQAGRILSASKLAMASTRVMGTCAVGGQAVGSAASMCIEHDCLPAEIGGKIELLQQRLIRDDCYLPGIDCKDPLDLASSATAHATSQLPDCPAENVVNGMTRNVGSRINCWESNGISPDGEVLRLDLREPSVVDQIRLTFDSNLNRPLKITLSAKRIAEQQVGVPVELVKNYRVILSRNGKTVAERTITDNHQRLNILNGINAMRIRHLLVTHNHYDHFLADNLISRPQGAFPVSVYISEASGNALAQKCEKIRAKPGVTGLRPICCPDVTFVEPFHSFRCGEYTAVPLAANHDPSVGSLNFLIKSGTKAILWLHDTGPLPQSTLAFLRGLGQYISFISMDCALAEGKCYSDDHMDILRCGETVRLLRQCGCVDDNTVVCLSHIGHLVECTHQELVDRAGQFGFKAAHDGMEVYV